MKVGYFTRIAEEKQPDRFGGEIELVGVVNGHFRLVEHEERRKPRSPHYALEIYQGGRWCPAGNAWYEEPRGGGDKYFSISIQIPALGKNQRVSAFECDESEQPEGWKKGDPCMAFNVVWSPPQARSTLSGSEPQLNDSVVY